MPDSVCVDASVAVQLVTPEEESVYAEALWTGWIAQGLQPIAPPTFHYEVCSVLRQKVQLRNELSAGEAAEAVELFLSLDVWALSPPELPKTAWELAVELNLPTVYDTVYLALAQIEGCDLWTADRGLYNTTARKFGFVRLLGEDQPHPHG